MVIPVVADEVKPAVEEVAPVATEEKVEAPVAVEPTPVVNEPKVEEPVAKEAPVVENIDKGDVDKFTNVTPLYVGMAEVKTGNDPHRVIAVSDNNIFAKNQSEEKTLIMNKVA